MADEAELANIACATCGQAPTRRRTGLFCWPCQLQASQCSVRPVDVLSMLLRCTGCAEIQKVVLDQTSSRASNRDHDLFWVQVWFWEVLWRFLSVRQLNWSSPVVVYNPFPTFCLMSQPSREMVYCFVE